MTREEYRDVYLRSDHWRDTRLAALERAEHRCQVCNRDGTLDVHHRTYERIGEERPADLTVLCRSCHNLFHEHRGLPKGSARQRKQQPLTKAQRKAKRRAAQAAKAASPVNVARLTAGRAGKPTYGMTKAERRKYREQNDPEYRAYLERQRQAKVDFEAPKEIKPWDTARVRYEGKTPRKEAAKKRAA
jgi:hypothetical protein